MTKISFSEYVQNQNQLLSQLESTMALKKTGELYFKRLVGLSEALEIAYPKEITQVLKNLKVSEKFTEMVIEVENKLKNFKRYNLDMAGQQVILIDKKGQEIHEPTITAIEFLDKELKIKKDSPYYYIVLSYFCQNDRFEIVQLYNSLKKH